jgi:hypothetical protein
VRVIRPIAIIYDGGYIPVDAEFRLPAASVG